MPENKTIEELGIDDQVEVKVDAPPAPAPEPPKLVLGKFKDEQEAATYMNQLEQNQQAAMTEINNLKQQRQVEIPKQPQQNDVMTSDKFWEDPIAATRKLTQEQLGQGAQPLYQAITNLTKMTVKSQLPDYDKYEKDIDEIVNALAPDQRMNPDVHRMAYQMALGKEAMANRVKAAQVPFTESPSAGRDKVTPEYNLTREQKIMAKSFGMSEKEYADELSKTDIRTA